jgi:hypothetical protein
MQVLPKFFKLCAVAGGMLMGMVLKMLVAAVLFASPSFAHSWYPADCCSGKDCMPAEEVIKVGKGEYRVLYKDDEGKVRSIFVPPQIRPRLSRDVKAHICVRTEVMGYDMGGKVVDTFPTCLFLPYMD